MTAHTLNGTRSSTVALPWLVWGAAAALYGFGQIVRHSPSAMIDPLMRDFAVDATSLGLIASIFWYAYAALQLPGGFLLDRYGPARVMSGGAVFAGIGCLIFALAPNDSVALIARFLMGAGFATSYVGCLKSASQWFARHRYSTLVGLSVLAGMLGAIIGQAPMAALVGMIGWRTVAFGFAAFAVPIALILLLSGCARPPDAEPPPRLKELFAMLGEAARSRQVWYAGLNNLGTTAPVVAFSLWGVAYYMQVFGLSRPEAATYTSTILIGWAIGSPIIGYISARLRRRRPVTLICSSAGVILWLLIVFVMPDLPRATHYVFLFALGFASGLVSVTFSLAAEHGPPRAPGVSSAMVNTLVMGGAALSQGIVGVVLDARWDGAMRAGIRLYGEDAFDTAFLLLPAMAGGGLLAACFVRETCAKLKGEAVPHAALADAEAP
ncbi:MAG: MFS transporter [Alphaproteobacteria bacterium]|nr:MFS transporter [Alphaproteobacteria bacterium]